MRAFIVLTLLGIVSAQYSNPRDDGAGEAIQSGDLGDFSDNNFGDIREEKNAGNPAHVSSSFGSVTKAFGQIVGDPIDIGADATGLSSSLNTASSSAPQGGFTATSESDSPIQIRQPTQFYTYTADENDFVVPEVESTIESVRQPSSVFLIMSPQNKKLENDVFSLAKQTTSKTDIYVLNKAVNIDELAEKVNSISQNSNNRPAVYFIKYRSEDDVEEAHGDIHSQYDALGGSSKNFEGGVAPVLDFTSKVSDASGSVDSAAEPK